MDGNINEPDVAEEMVDPNVNCLAGKRCPKCGSHGPFEVEVTMRILLSDTGSDDAEDGTIDYEDNAPAMCYDCRYEGKFNDFNVR